MISAVDLLRGIACLAGMEVIHVPGATGFLDTDTKRRPGGQRPDRLDFVYVHVEAPTSAGTWEAWKRRCGQSSGSTRLSGSWTGRTHRRGPPDHPTPIRYKTHTMNPVPFALLGKGRYTGILRA